MSVKLLREATVQSVTIAAGAATSSAFVVDGFAIGMVHLPSTFDGTAITFTVCATAGGTYVPYEGSDGSAVSITTSASNAFALPEGLFGTRYAKLVSGSNQADTDTVITITTKG